ncbi:NF038132 family protein [Desulfurivibrio dismutans]|uniref:NF038132 family protein n=1 Tax=Desulfurivibrio dismutans TaxID=1398908 RepID=UPI0023DB1FAB|nr:NF038132 family protein [Desulfurivibrio alkaliphilus]MDF1614073.1 NF038132 family protein [Desulfurivibrio alkaliphilus]
MKKRLLVHAVWLAGIMLANPAHAIDITGWGGVGSYGSLGANGVVTAPPSGDSQYGWVSTNGGVSGVGLGLGSETNGSVISSPLFSAETNDLLEFYFNYVTSDGAGYADYGWAKLLDDTGNDYALLFTARTTPGGDTVPGFGMPALNATLEPASTPIIGGGPSWSPLGGSSGSCFSGGCGYTDWIKASYTITDPGMYALQIGVVNWGDTAYDTGMAFDGATIAGIDIGGDGPAPVPAPATMLLFATGMISLAGARLRRNKST